MKIEIGDWVKASYYNNTVYGYVERLHSQVRRGTIRVLWDLHGSKMEKAVIDEDNIIWKNKFEFDQTDMESLVELALATKDKEWFIELTEACKKMKNTKIH